MPELVNSTAKSQLDSSRNQEPTHLSGPSYETLGGPGVNSEPGGADYKIDAARGMSQDTTIPKAVPAEGSHLNGSTVAENDTEVSFDDEDPISEADDIDNELDKFNEADVDVELKEDDEDEKLDESDEDEKLDESDEDDAKDIVKEDDEDGDDKKFNFQKESDDEDAKDIVKEDDEDGDDKKFNFEEDESEKDKAIDESDEDEKDLKESAVRIRIKVPAIKLNESVIPAKSQKKVAVLFEQAIKQTTKQVSSQLHKHYRALHESKLAKRDTAMAKQIDGYLTYVVEEWTKQNRVAIRQSLRTQLAEEFMNGLQKLFKEHYIDVPESKVDVVKQLQKQLAVTNKRLNEQTAKTMKVHRLAENANKLRIVANFSRGMSEQSARRMLKLAESTRYTNSADFKAKLTILKETYFPTGASKTSKVLAEEMVRTPGEDKTKTETKTAPAGDPIVAAAAAMLQGQHDRAKW